MGSVLPYVNDFYDKWQKLRKFMCKVMRLSVNFLKTLTAGTLKITRAKWCRSLLLSVRTSWKYGSPRLERF